MDHKKKQMLAHLSEGFCETSDAQRSCADYRKKHMLKKHFAGLLAMMLLCLEIAGNVPAAQGHVTAEAKAGYPEKPESDRTIRKKALEGLRGLEEPEQTEEEELVRVTPGAIISFWPEETEASDESMVSEKPAESVLPMASALDFPGSAASSQTSETAFPAGTGTTALPAGSTDTLPEQSGLPPSASAAVYPTQTPYFIPVLPSGTAPGISETPSAAPEETELPDAERLKKVTGIRLVRFSTHAVKVTWKRNKKARFYKVYCSKKGSGRFRCRGTTAKQHLLVKGLKNKKAYTFYVKACRQRKASDSDSLASERASITMKSYHRKTIFAGDSICEGIGMGWSFPQMHTSGTKKTVAYRGLNTVTFHTKRIFDGKTGLQKLIAEKPYRAYMMLGMNEIFYRKTDEMIAEYKGMIKDIRRASPHTDIVLCAVSPVTRAEKASHPGMWQIPVFNRKLKKLAKKLKLTYLDYTDFLKDSDGYLKAEYAAADGYHWKPSAYVEFGRIVGRFDRSLDL